MGWQHLVALAAIVFLLFGAAKLPALAKSLGQSARVFKGEMKALRNENNTKDDKAEDVADVADVASTPADDKGSSSNTTAP